MAKLCDSANQVCYKIYIGSSMLKLCVSIGERPDWGVLHCWLLWKYFLYGWDGTPHICHLWIEFLWLGWSFHWKRWSFLDWWSQTKPHWWSVLHWWSQATPVAILLSSAGH